jgi:hypothetical protein
MFYVARLARHIKHSIHSVSQLDEVRSENRYNCWSNRIVLDPVGVGNFFMYTYAFIHRIASVTLPEGISGQLQIIGADNVIAIAEPNLNLETLQSSDDRLLQSVLQHDRVIRDLFLQTTVLPLRFGTLFVSEEKLVEHLQTHETVYLQQLDRLAGQAEYTLKLVPGDRPESLLPAETSGRDYFLAKKQRLLEQQIYQQQQQQQFQQLQAEIQLFLQNALPNAANKLILAEPQDSIERIYLLCPQSIESRLIEVLENWRRICTDWHLSLDEGLPPYHFV